ncbi:hypothetical protein [Streptomyces sp. RerS4]|uniref:hypothetical protein n=1 Tax=Streptomyces sp. RerS4 TaxID=2942449 RepID=UPI00201C365D|nr:hypothetical protein [Streptomyces sp. RerS4]UQW99884.1 hypothetical protein M4D82_04535 [Streptomyces sp. RerS4]
MEFRPTHVVPPDGLPTWETPDASRPTAPLDPFLPVRLVARRGDWGEILCANGWSAWVDGRLLVAVPQPPPTLGVPLARTDDPEPLLAHTADALERYLGALRAQREPGAASAGPDGEEFRRALAGLRAGIVIDGASVWIYDDTTRRWMYADGGHPATYAVTTGPEAAPAPQPPPGEGDSGARGDVREVPHDPTRVVERPEPGGP